MFACVLSWVEICYHGILCTNKSPCVLLLRFCTTSQLFIIPDRLSHPLAVVLLRRAEPVGRAAVGHAAADSRNSSRACRAIARPGRCPMLAGDGGRRRAVRGGVRRGQHGGGAQQRGGGDLLLRCVLQLSRLAARRLLRARRQPDGRPLCWVQLHNPRLYGQTGSGKSYSMMGAGRRASRR